MYRLYILLVLLINCVPGYAAKRPKPVTDLLFIEHSGRMGDSTLLVYNVPKRTGKELMRLNKMKATHKGGYDLYLQKTNKILKNYAHTWLKAMPV